MALFDSEINKALKVLFLYLVNDVLFARYKCFSPKGLFSERRKYFTFQREGKPIKEIPL